MPHRRCSIRAALTALALSPVLVTSQQTAPITSAIRCAQLVEIRSGAILQRVVIAINGAGRIERVTPGGELPPGGVDLEGVTCLPGLIDVHTHLLMELGTQLGWDDPNLLLLVATQSTARRALMGARVAREYLNAGITTIRDLGNAGVNGDVALRDAVASAWVQGPRMVVSTRALAPPGGQFGPLTPEAQSLVTQEYATVSGVDDARRATRQAIYDGADLIKIIVNSGARSLSLPEVEAIVDEARRAGKRVAAHATTDEAARTAATAGVASIEHAYDLTDETLRMMAAKRIFLVPTDYTAELNGAMYITPGVSPEARAVRMKSYEERDRAHSTRLQRAVAAGVPIAFGSDIYYALPGQTRGQSSLKVLLGYAAAGLTTTQVLQSATIGAATLLGAADRVASVEPGRWADIIAVAGNPLENLGALQSVRFVMKGGRIVRNDPARN